MDHLGERFATFGLVGVLGLVLLFLIGSLVAAPNNHAVAGPSAPGRVIRLTTAEGLTIEASHWPSARVDALAVLLLHGIDASGAMFDAHAAWLHELGYAILAPDFRGHGGSAARERTFGWRETEEAAVAFAFLRSEAPNRKIGVIGISMGGAAALLGRDGPLPADALVLQAVYPNLRTAIANRVSKRAGRLAGHLVEPLLSYQSWLRYGVSPNRIAPIEGLKRFAGPVLVIGGTGDVETPPSATRALHTAAPGPKSLWLVNGANHVETCDLWTEAYRERVGDFLADALGMR